MASVPLRHMRDATSFIIPTTSSAASHQCMTSLEPIKPAPPVIRYMDSLS